MPSHNARLIPLNCLDDRLPIEQAIRHLLAKGETYRGCTAGYAVIQLPEAEPRCEVTGNRVTDREEAIREQTAQMRQQADEAQRNVERRNRRYPDLSPSPMGAGPLRNPTEVLDIRALAERVTVLERKAAVLGICVDDNRSRLDSIESVMRLRHEAARVHGPAVGREHADGR
jgi:hypothetical protein